MKCEHITLTVTWSVEAILMEYANQSREFACIKTYPSLKNPKTEWPGETGWSIIDQQSYRQDRE